METIQGAVTGDSLLGFWPDPERGRLLDARRHAELAGSLAHLADALPAAKPALGGVVARIEAGERLPPLAFGIYFQLAMLAMAGKPDQATVLAESLADIPAAAPGLTLSRWGEADTAGLVSIMCVQDPDAPERYADAPEEQRQEFRRRLDAGLELLAAEAPELHGEAMGIVRQVLLACPPEGSTTVFDGASHYQFWGLLMLNPNHHTTPVAVAEALAHEAGHSLLFGLTVSEPLVFNSDDELFPSPLRVDPRPMDGIYHATFVSARMAWTMERLAASQRLDAQERATARAAAATDRDNFHKG